MDNFYNAPVIWIIAGFIFFLLEFAVPGLILFFFAIGAWIVGILSLFFDMSVNTQLLIFLGSTVLTILLFRKWVSKLLEAKKVQLSLNMSLLAKEVKLKR
jgi:membrane protein implicated in regulation of membrane protease activity